VPPVSEEVVAIVDRTWPSRTHRDRALAILAAYGQAAHEREPARVQLAILKLSDGVLNRIAELLSAAKQDYRSAELREGTLADLESLLALQAAYYFETQGRGPCTSR
jgi:hypothetical protein